MLRLLLISNSTQHGSGYLEHCADEVVGFFGGDGDRRKILFVPYALKDLDAYAKTARRAFEAMGHDLISLHEAHDPIAAIKSGQGMFTGGGNTFRLLARLQDERLIEAIRARVRAGMPYMGTSAGSNLACPTIRTTNDMPIVQPRSFDALDLVPFQINPHYLDPDPSSDHMGETRELRIREFHEENVTPVVGLREGGILRVDGSQMTLLGARPARLFRADQEPVEFPAGADLSMLLGGA